MNVMLVHLTDDVRLPSIMEHGLSPNHSREPAFRERSVYLSGDERHARGYVDHHGDWLGKPVLLGVSSDDLRQEALGPDDVDLPDLVEADQGTDWTDVSWLDSLSISGQCTYADVIPGSMIVYRYGDEEWKPLSEWHPSQLPSPRL